jgi:hypothetical protein
MGDSAYCGSKFALEGVVEGLNNEVSHFGIKSLLIEPGRFQTRLLSETNMRGALSKIPAYAENSKALMEILRKEDWNQPGDSAKLAKIVIDLVKQEGIAAGRDVPFRLPLGIDVYDDIKAKCEATLRLLEEWKDVIRSTDRDNLAPSSLSPSHPSQYK